MNSYYDENGLVICQECNKPFHFITARHLFKWHKMTSAEYKDKYPNIPMAKINFNKKPRVRNKKEPIIEELNFDDNTDNEFQSIEELHKKSFFGDEKFGNKSEDKTISELSKNKIPTPTKQSDPMNDKLDILSYLKLTFHNIKNNYTFTKKKPNGSIEYQFVTDMADPSAKIVFDFPNSFWHNNDTRISTHFRNALLNSYGWTVVTVKQSMPKVQHVDSELKNLK